MRVLHIIESLGVGGAEQILAATMPELERQGVIPVVAVLRPPYDLACQLEAVGLKVIRLDRRSKWRLWSAGEAIRRAVPDADVWHAHLYFPSVITALARWTGRMTAASCVSLHNLAYEGANRRSWKLEGKRRLLAFLLRRGSDHVQAVSGAVANHAARQLGLSGVTVIPNGIDLADLEPRRSDDGSGIVVPGRLVAEKGHRDLLDAVALLSPDCGVVTFAGGGPLEAELRERADDLGLTVRFTGTLSRAEMLETMRQARLVVVPSRFEGFGLTALEALALGVPVVASDAGGLPEVLGDAGLLFPRGHVESLAKSISRALTDQSWRETQLTAGPARAARFSLAQVTARQVGIYSSLHGRRP